MRCWPQDLAPLRALGGAAVAHRDPMAPSVGRMGGKVACASCRGLAAVVMGILRVAATPQAHRTHRRVGCGSAGRN